MQPSMQPERWGESYLSKVISCLEDAGVRTKKLTLDQIAQEIFCEYVTSLRKGTAGLSRLVLAERLDISHQAVGKLLARLVELKLLKIKRKFHRYSPFATEYQLGPVMKKALFPRKSRKAKA